MKILIGSIVLIYGVIFGSFFNVMIYRFPIEQSVIRGRSFCPICKTKLAAKDLIPVFSQLRLKNRCRYCDEKISIRYPIIELATGLLFLLSYCLYGFGWDFFRHIILWSMLLNTAIIDYEHMVIMDAVLLLFSPFMIFYIIFSGAMAADYLLGGAIGFGAYLLIYLLARLVYREEAFGLGDVLLMGSAGFFFGKNEVIVAAIMSFYIAVFVIVIRKFLGGQIKRKDEIPFGPYICIAVFITSIFGVQIIDYIKTLFYS